MGDMANAAMRMGSGMPLIASAGSAMHDRSGKLPSAGRVTEAMIVPHYPISFLRRGGASETTKMSHFCSSKWPSVQALGKATVLLKKGLASKIHKERFLERAIRSCIFAGRIRQSTTDEGTGRTSPC